MNPTLNAHFKLLAVDILSLGVVSPSSSSSSSSSSASPTIFRRISRPISRAESVGIVVSLDRRPKFLRFLIDDGSGCLPCILWLNQRLLHQCGDQTASIAAIAHAEKVRLGGLIRVRGRLTFFRGQMQVTVSDVFLERDPNAEILHWLQCMKLARDCYDLPPPRLPAAD